MLKNIQETQIALKTDLEIWLELKKRLEVQGITNFDQLTSTLRKLNLSNLNDINDYLRSIKVDFETAMLIQVFIKRVQQVRNSRLEKFYSSSQVGKYLIDFYRGFEQESLLAIYLDSKNKVIAEKIIFIGSLNKSIAHPREIFKQAILFNSAAFIVAHNHPSGDTTPSKQDLNFTERLVLAGETIGIDCLDHFVIGGNYYLSLKEEDLL